MRFGWKKQSFRGCSCHEAPAHSRYVALQSGWYPLRCLNHSDWWSTAVYSYSKGSVDMNSAESAEVQVWAHNSSTSNQEFAQAACSKLQNNEVWPRTESYQQCHIFWKAPDVFGWCSRTTATPLHNLTCNMSCMRCDSLWGAKGKMISAPSRSGLVHELADLELQPVGYRWCGWLNEMLQNWFKNRRFPENAHAGVRIPSRPLVRLCLSIGKHEKRPVQACHTSIKQTKQDAERKCVWERDDSACMWLSLPSDAQLRHQEWCDNSAVVADIGVALYVWCIWFNAWMQVWCVRVCASIAAYQKGCVQITTLEERSRTHPARSFFIPAVGVVYQQQQNCILVCTKHG